MPSKSFVLDDGLAVTIYKRRGSRNLRLSVTAAGQVRVSMPTWAPYKTGLDFARSRQGWIAAQATKPALLIQGQPIGKAHHLQFIALPTTLKASGRVLDSAVVVSYPPSISIESPEVQAAAEKACVRALRRQAEQLLPQRLAALAAKHGCHYKSVSIKRLKSRWGSCDQSGNIVLNLFLMQLPWELIDYVLLHELTHTEILRHGSAFWQAMAAKTPKLSQMRKAIRAHSPVLSAGDSMA